MEPKEASLALEQGPGEAARWLDDVVVSRREIDRGTTAIGEFVQIYDESLTLAEREIVLAAYLRLLRSAVARFDPLQTSGWLPALLFLGIRIAPLQHPRWRREVQFSLTRLIDRAVAAGDPISVTALLNFAVDTDLDVGEARLSACAEQAGASAFLPAFLILAKHSPSRALQWTVSHSHASDLTISTVRVGLDALLFAGIDLRLADSARFARLLVRTELDLAIRTLDDKELASDLEAVVKAVVRNVEDDASEGLKDAVMRHLGRLMPSARRSAAGPEISTSATDEAGGTVLREAADAYEMTADELKSMVIETISGE